jgi:ribosome-binding ATPase
VQLVLDKLGVKEPSDLHLWKEDDVQRLVSTFMDMRFPTLIIANKCDMPGADLNIARLCDKYGEVSICTGALDM